jgi:multidrug efflux system membrane fusion protein
MLSLVVLAYSCSVHAAMAFETNALKVITVQSSGAVGRENSLDGVVEAVRQTTLSAQVAGAVVALPVKAGDRVKAGQELVRLDARAAQQQVVGATAQLEAAQANLTVVSKELDRQRHLLQKNYISQAAFDRSQAQWDAANAQVKALQAQTQAAQTQSGFFVLSAPYAGVVTDVAVTLGDMAMPGRPLVTMHDPSALRVTAAIPQSLLAGVSAQRQSVRYELPGLVGPSTPQTPVQVQVLPAIDPVTHTGQIRLNLPAGMEGVAPGLFARIWWPETSMGKDSLERFTLPSRAIVRRAEMTGVYVLDAQGKPSLRQVRLGRTFGDQVEVLSGLRKDDKVVAEPQLAVNAR